MTSADGMVILANGAFRRLIEAPDARAVVGRSIPDLVATGAIGRFLEAHRAAAAGETWRGPLELQLRGRVVDVQAEVSPGDDEMGRLVLWRLIERTTGDSAREVERLRVHIATLEAATEVTDPAAACRALLQEIRYVLPFDWAVVLRFADGGAEVLANYPSAMAGAETGTRWMPADSAERNALLSETPSLEHDLQVTTGHHSPLSRLPGFGLQSALRVPLFRGGTVIGSVSLYAYRPDAFSPEDGIALERYARPLAARLGEVGPAAGPREVPELGRERARPTEDTSREQSPPRDATTTPAAAATGDETAEPEPERLATLGALVSGVAHELNNPLTTILGYAHRLPALAGEEQREAASTIEQEAERAGRIIRDLLYFARQQRPRMERVDLNSLLERIVTQRRGPLAEHDIRLDARLTLLPSVRGDEYQLEQVFLNLIHNAQLALHPAGGTITLTSEAIEGHVRISVQDNGPGIPEEVRTRVFEPFVTTRDVGHGPGLGLSIAYGIVREHGGRLLVEQGQTGGARLIVELPLPVNQTEEPPTRADAGAAREGHGELLLVVDDEAPIRTLMSEILRASGYTVLQTESAEDALELLVREPVDLVISDLRMPGMDGLTLYGQIRARWPQLAPHVVLMSGDIELASAEADAGSPVTLSKPFTAGQLLATVRQALQRV